ncbi:hypothetical protein PIB30_099466, partial [Stylosanthes scabra]|nr:hypothetical protein [Stylosanthes scabra]
RHGKRARRKTEEEWRKPEEREKDREMDKLRWEDGACVATVAAEASPIAIVAKAPPSLENRRGERKSNWQRRKDDPFPSLSSYKAPTAVELQPLFREVLVVPMVVADNSLRRPTGVGFGGCIWISSKTKERLVKIKRGSL